MGEEPLVREAVEADLPRLLELLDQLPLDAPSEDPGPPQPEGYRQAFRQIAADTRQRILVLERNGRLLATLVLVIVPNLTHGGRPYAIVENVVVEAGARGAGLGEALMRRAIALARDAGCYKVSLTSNKHRPNAHRFYERLGFNATHEGYRIDL